LRGLVPVGWYHSHTRSGLCLTDQDLEIYNRRFPEHWQVAMVLQPCSGRPTRVGFFIRDPDGSVQVEASYQEFEAGPIPEVELPASHEEVQAPVERLPVPEQAESEIAEAPAEAESAPALAAPAARRRRDWVAGIGLLAAICLGMTGVGLLVSSYWNKSVAPPLSVRLVDKDGRLEIQWDPATEAVRGASRGLIEVQDGKTATVIPLDAAALRSGSLTVARNSGDVGVRLRVQTAGGEPVVGVARFLGRPGAPVSSTAPGIPPADQVRGEVEQLRAERDRLEGELSKLVAPVPQVAASKKARRPKQMLPVPRQRASNRPRAEVPSPPMLAPQMQVISGSPQLTRPPENLPAPPPASAAQERVALPKPAPAPEAVKSPPAYRGPTSGKLIWTGFLQRNSVLSIEGKRASSGQLTGELPNVPLRIGAFPAELAGGGLTVFSANPKFSRTPVTEPPGPQNGWNRTVYRYAPGEAQELVVVEAPNPEEGRNRILLRSGERQFSVILIEWEVIR
jgi:hypothetical protein